FLVAVVAVIQGMNAYVRERIGGAIVGVNAFQVRRTPIAVGLIDDEQWKEIQRRPIIAPEDVHYVERALPDAKAIAVQSGWPTPQADVVWRNKTVGDAFVFGVTAPFQVVQDYQFAAGEALSDVDVRERRPVAALGFDIADRLFDYPDQAIGQKVRILGVQYSVKSVIAKKGNVLGQSWDGFVMLMLMSVNERTHEIGIRKSLGARRRDIRNQFLAESVTLALLGGLLGLVSGVGLAAAVAAISPLPTRVTAWSVALALGLGAGVGIVFGVHPAMRAARLDPVVALRYE